MDLLTWMGSACAVHMLSTSVYSGNLPDDDGEVLGRLEQMSLGLSPRAAAAVAGAVTAPRLLWRVDAAGARAEEGAGRGDGSRGGRSRSGGERGGRRTGGKDQESL